MTHLINHYHCYIKRMSIFSGREGPQGDGGDNGEYGSLGEKGFRVSSEYFYVEMFANERETYVYYAEICTVCV